MTNSTKMIVGGAIAFLMLLGVASLPDENFLPQQSPTTTTPTPEPKSSGLTLAAYEKITAGMTYAEVVAIAGFEGTSMSVVEIAGVAKTEVFMWQNKNGSNMNVTFQGDAMISKAQFGLK